MAVDWNIPYRAGALALQELQQQGEDSTRRIQNQRMQHELLQDQQQAAARPGIQQQVASGDYRGAQAAAVGAGDYKYADAIAGLDETKRKQLASEADLLGRASFSLKRIPAEQRSAAFVAMLPRFKSLGFNADELREYASDLSDDALDGRVSMSQSINDHLTGDLTQARINDVSTDNARADLLADNTIDNTQDTMRDRTERRALTARGQSMADARGRYGIAVSHSDRVRGQDMTDARGRYSVGVAHEDRVRGQDMAEARSQRPRPGRAGRGGAAAAPASLPLARTPAEAKALPPGTVFRTPDGRTLRR